MLVNPYSAEEIADAMRRVLTNPELRADLSARSLARAREFSWERSARRVLDIYNEVAHS